MTKPKVPSPDSDDILLNNSELYKLLVEENRHQHQVWIDNFRIIITFNSIILTGVFAIITILSKGESPDSIKFTFPWFLRAISFIGTIVTLVGVHIIRRTKAISSLRIKEIRNLETNIGFELPIFPFEEGAFALGNQKEEAFWANKRKPPYQIEPLKLNPFGGLGGYLLIGGSFIIAHILIFLLSFLNVV